MTAAIILAASLLLTFLIPGTMAAFLAFRGKKTDILFFIISCGILGIACQMGIGFLGSLLFFIDGGPAIRIAIATGASIALLAWKYFRALRNQRTPTITVSAYDIATLIITGVLGLSLYGIMAHLPQPYFNMGSDQYYWLAYAIRAAHEPSIILSILLRDPIHQAFFFVLLMPHVSFLPHTLLAYQILMEAWQYGVYVFGSIALARLAYEALPMRIWGIMAPLAFYMLHWSNYYMISTDVVPQNIGIFLLIAGLIFLGKNIGGVAGIAFLTLFYLIHAATCAIFVLAVGTSAIAHKGVSLIKAKIYGEKYDPDWHIFEKICFAPTCVVIIFYGLYAAGLIAQYPIENIGYAYEYVKELTLATQPYIDTPQITLIRLALAGLAIVPLVAYFDKKRRRILLAIGWGFILPWVFLKTPFIAYHAFFASWQSFRYYLVMYPSISILALLPLSIAAFLLGSRFSKNLGIGITAIAIMLNIPILMRLVAMQQEVVTLDMITGRDGGKNAEKQIIEIKEFESIINSHPDGAVISFGSRAMTPYNQWVVAPRPWFVATAEAGCSERSCVAYDMFRHRARAIWDIPTPAVGIIEKGVAGEDEAHKAFKTIFSESRETDIYAIYGNPEKIGL